MYVCEKRYFLYICVVSRSQSLLASAPKGTKRSAGGTFRWFPRSPSSDTGALPLDPPTPLGHSGFARMSGGQTKTTQDYNTL